MAIHVLSIIKALAPIAANAAASFAGMRQSASGLKTEERIRKLEEETLQMGEGLAGLTLQVQALADALRIQAARHDAQDTQLRICLALAILALCGAGTAFIFMVNS